MWLPWKAKNDQVSHVMPPSFKSSANHAGHTGRAGIMNCECHAGFECPSINAFH